MNQFIGSNEYGELIEAELLESGAIRGFNGYDYIAKDQSYDGEEYLSRTSWTHEVILSGLVLRTGDRLPTDLPEIGEEDHRRWSVASQVDGVCCEKCGLFHDGDQYIDVSFRVINECEVFCKDCIESKDLLVRISYPADIFKARDISNMDAPDSYEELDILFCDSSGFGQPHEPALTRTQLIKKVENLIEENGLIFAGITEIGQFQCYITLFKKGA